ncbi:Glycosyltransferase [Candidatus Rhodobacter oscarellae]|uniref:Glycosyltransferase n=1 Tax=Candidatus Rhodobacter oscarellae TaxID=1675527 RepID=A0A0J9E6D7_9RHOB|nr:stealth conserved region 3 domain-containing protein [Candidatus Rhodobacter lobularis]KMW57394.1 Glycosyltransferase [Candidatus Rhodobacter lobularis]
MTDAEFDVVYTWVDDSFPGYLDELNRYSADKRDLNPNRTRDNLDLIRYSMRSVAKHLPQARRIYLLTCRPQVPPWLDAAHPKIRVVHHDQVMAPEILPTFSSFAIVSHLHMLPGLARRFVYFEDDFLANSNALLGALLAEDGRAIVNLGRHWILPQDKLNPATSSPWNLALAHADAVLSQRFGPGPRRQVLHGPQMFDREAMAAIASDYDDLFAATRNARFRAGDGVPPEVFVPLVMAATGAAQLAPMEDARRVEGYASLENFLPWTWAQLKRLDLRRPLSIALNDSFGARPNPRVERLVRGWLQAKFPDAAPWEKTHPA